MQGALNVKAAPVAAPNAARRYSAPAPFVGQRSAVQPATLQARERANIF